MMPYICDGVGVYLALQQLNVENDSGSDQISHFIPFYNVPEVADVTSSIR